MIGILHIGLNVFSKEVRAEIKKRANRKCDSCGKKVKSESELIAAHIKHGVRDKVDNGRAHCKYCEAEYHLEHADNPKKKINLCKQDNDSTVYMRVTNLPILQRLELIKAFPEQWAGVLKRLDKRE